ncbi:hypothetical protein PHYBOEH_008252 [Phytophthora boehmeriae]|uniref:Uncharacterized protein n=1 Tax=Phytophthora boehmeriae TaxID=109152 RepID=A0A8T1W2A9_9STRA|nr:hypothetical protein PHYBOEH_008252 [Phytophthora boehmeriae]
MAGNSITSKRKSEKSIQQTKREVPATLQPLDYTPTPKESIESVQMCKRPSQSGKHVKSRPHVLESLTASPQFQFVQEAPAPEKSAMMQ